MHYTYICRDTYLHTLSHPITHRIITSQTHTHTESAHGSLFGSPSPARVNVCASGVADPPPRRSQRRHVPSTLHTNTHININIHTHRQCINTQRHTHISISVHAYIQMCTHTANTHTHAHAPARAHIHTHLVLSMRGSDGWQSHAVT